MKKFLFFVSSLAFGSILFIWVIKEIGWKEIESVFHSFSLWKAFIILVLTFSTALVKAWRWKIILKNQGYKISAPEIFEYYLSGLTVSFLIPMVVMGGEIFRCYDLKERYSVPWTKSIASVIIDRVLEITVYSALIIIGVVFFIFRAGFPSGTTGIIIFSIIALAILGIIVFYFKSFKKESIIYFFLKGVSMENSGSADAAMEIENEIFKYFRPKQKIMWEGFGISALSGAFALIRTFFLITFLGKTIGITVASSVLGFSYLATIVPIPAAIGSHELVQSFVFGGLGLGANTGAAFALTVRCAETVLALIGSIFFVKFGIQIAESSLVRKITSLFNIKGGYGGKK